MCVGTERKADIIRLHKREVWLSLLCDSCAAIASLVAERVMCPVIALFFAKRLDAVFDVVQSPLDVVVVAEEVDRLDKRGGRRLALERVALCGAGPTRAPISAAR